MPERILLTGGPEEASAQLWAHIQEKTMLNGEHLEKFDSLTDAAEHHLPSMSREGLEALNTELIRTLIKMRKEREDIFEKNSALEDAVGKLCKEKVYMQREMAKAVNCMTQQQKYFTERLSELRSQATASGPTDQGSLQTTEPTPDESLQCCRSLPPVVRTLVAIQCAM